ncbi:MAG: chlorite dismutase family protein [Armatimonadetes bacterium]|nr:chlorite dismutase family protein [Armatimonadota bacterium]
MEDKSQRQFVQYTAYQVDPAWRRLPEADRERGKKECVRVLEEFSGRLILRTYTLVGIRGDGDFLLWKVAPSLEGLQELQTRLLTTPMGGYLTVPHSYLGMTKRSIYIEKHVHEGQEGQRLKVVPGKAGYLFVYPFVKTRAWYALPKERRQEMMDEHIRIGHRYPTVKLNTSYSFGIDDQEFVVAFESDSAADFLDLIMELRESQASAYTLRDTPILTCLAKEPAAMLETLG